MNKRQSRLAVIVDILQHNNVGSQDDLLRMLIDRGCNVTQATLSRDLKTLRTSKVATEMGGYRYMVPGQPAQEQDSLPDHRQATPDMVSNIISVSRSGYIVVLKTRIGYAQSVARDIDAMQNPHILGTVAGVDTVIIATNHSSSARDVYLALSLIIPMGVMNGSRRAFFG